MRSVDILEWVSGWAWPILLVLGGLVAWGIARVESWNARYRLEEPSSGMVPGKKGVCRCD